MHHKRGKPKNARAGCLMCKSHKMNGWKHGTIETTNQKRLYHANLDLRQFLKS